MSSMNNPNGSQNTSDLIDGFGHNLTEPMMSFNSVEEEVKELKEWIHTLTKVNEELKTSNKHLKNKVFTEVNRRKTAEVMVKKMKKQMKVIKKKKKCSSAQRHEVYRRYEKNSFDRFGDDLSELLLSYLDFEDKVRFECVSKQWQRLVFNKVIDISHISFCVKNSIEKLKNVVENNNLINPKSKRKVTLDQMKTILKKCPNVKTIKFYVNSETIKSLSLLSDNCHKHKAIKSIKLYIDSGVTSESMTDFFQTLGSKVEDISIARLSDNIELLKWCPNLKRLKSNDWQTLVNNEFVPTLECLDFVSVQWEEMPAFIQLVDKYEKTLKNIKNELNEYTLYYEDIESYIQQLYRFKKLESLEFCSQYPFTLDLSPLLINSMENCTNLNKINFYNSVLAITKPSKSLVGIENLDISCEELSDDFFTNLPDLMPNLRILYIHTEEQEFTNQDLIDISRLKHIQELTLYTNQMCIYSTDDSGVIQILKYCSKLKKVFLSFSPNITVKTIDKLIEVANNRHKERISFCYKSSGNESEAFRQSLTRIPDNLAITLRE